MFDLQSTQPRQIKVTDSVSNSKRADAKALENAKTGKVTAVVADMAILRADQLSMMPKLVLKRLN
jgi:hypothetical protein